MTADICSLGMGDTLTFYELYPDGTKSDSSLLAMNEKCSGGETAELSAKAIVVEFIADYESGGGGFAISYTTLTPPNHAALIAGVVVPVSVAFIATLSLLFILWRRSIRKVRDLQLRLGMIEVDVTGTPAEGVVKSLLELKDRKVIKAKDREELLRIVGLISTNKLFKMDLRKKLHNVQADNEVNDFLFTTLAQDNMSTPRLDQLASLSTDNMLISEGQPKRDSSEIFKDTEFLLNLPKWTEFDIVALNSAHGSPVCRLADLLLDATNLCQTLSLDRSKVKCFVKKLQAGYQDNPYHSALHAADTAQALYSLIAASGFNFTPLELLAALFAALAHDFRHPGRTNAFLINTKDPIAIRYNHQSVLESMHAAESVGLMLEEDSNFVSNFDRETWIEFHRIYTSMILATDMGKHGEILGQIAVKLAGSSFVQENKADRLLILDLLMKVADLSNGTRKWELCQFWTDSVTAEFFAQGDAEKERKLPVSAFMDRATSDVPKCQITFLSYIVEPLVEVLGKICPKSAAPLKTNILNNLSHWKELKAQSYLTPHQSQSRAEGLLASGATSPRPATQQQPMSVSTSK